MRQLAKYVLTLFVSACFLAVLFSYCGGKFCKLPVEADKVSVLIGQLQGQCWVYDDYPVGACQKMSLIVPHFEKLYVSSTYR